MAVIDSQSVKTTESGGPCGYDAGKRIKGRKRHIAVDAQGSPIVMMVHPADVQDRDAALEVVIQLLATVPTISKLYADGGYAGPKLRKEFREQGLSDILEIVEKPKARCCPAGGSWSGPLPGWADAVACRRITSATLTMPWPGRNWPPVDFLSGTWRVKQPHDNK